LKELLLEYKESLKATKNLYDKSPEEDKKIISGMISDIEYVIKWIKSGRMPGNSRPIERSGVYKNTIFYDPAVFSARYSDRCSLDPFVEIDERIDREAKRCLMMIKSAR
jgi:hypothetical protein